MIELPVVELVREVAASVALAVLPLAAIFFTFQVLFLKLPGREVSRIAIGTLLASAGLFLFLLGVEIGFLPFGRAIGEALGELDGVALVVGFGLVLGFVTTWGEPSVRILADQVEDASTGSIRRSLVLWTVCLGVALAVGVGLLRIAYGIPLLYIVAPGYALVVALLRFSDAGFIGIAIDAGGVATGPLANTFLLALAVGASAAAGGQDPLAQGLGLVSLISLASILSVIVLGVLVARKGRKE